MTLIEAIQQRHSVRSYQNKPLSAEHKQALEALIQNCNQESGLHIQLVTDEPKAFDCMMAHYGSFSGVTNYIALIGKKSRKLDELCGYYGEKLVLEAQRMGLNTCWVGLTYKKIPSAFQLELGETLCIVIAVGYGTNPGKARKSKTPAQVAEGSNHPDWFWSGIDAALLAPTAVNQQKFRFSRNDNQVTAKAGLGFYSTVDLGIVKLHFEIGAGKENFVWGVKNRFVKQRTL